MYEVILPKKLGYFGKVQEVLEDLFDEAAIRAIPFVRRSVAMHRQANPAFDAEAWIARLCHASRGYSIYEMDGRYLGRCGPIDERVLVIRFVFRQDDSSNGAGAELLDASIEVVNHLVAHRFAEELGVEDEIWILEYPHTQLAIWRKDVTASPEEFHR